MKVELDGYETAYSEWLEVPPPQTNVNIKMNRKEKPVVDSFEAYETFAVLTFSQYMSPETVKNVQLQDADGNEFKYSLSYPGDETDADGNVYARRYILRYENMAEKSKMMHLMIGDGVKSSSGISLDQEKRTASTVPDLGIIGDDYVKIAIGDTFDYEFQLKGYTDEKITIQIDNPSIVECIQSDEVSTDGKGKILLKPLAYGSAAITISVEGKAITKKIDVSVCDETVSGKRESSEINLPSSTDQPSPAPEPPASTQTPVTDQKSDSPKDTQNKVQGLISVQGTENKKTGKPAKVSSLKLKAKKKCFTAKWKKVKGAKGYQIQYAVSKKKLSKGKRKNVKKASVTIKKLKKKKTYYVRVRAYRQSGKKKIYGRWSAVKKVKIRK